MASGERLLVVGPAWVGDMVMAQSLYRELMARRPGVAIDVVAPEWSLPLLERMPEVAEGIRLPVGHGRLGLARRYRLGVELRRRGYTQAVVLPRSLKAALVPFIARVPVRTGYRGEMRYGLINDMRRLDREGAPTVIRRYAALGRERDADPVEPPWPRLATDTANLERTLGRLGLAADRPAIALAPGAEYGPAKQWPPERFGQLAAGLADAGYQVWVIGSGKDEPVADRIVEQAGGKAFNLCGRTSLTDAVDLLAAARALVTNDSGLMHIGAAVGTPVVAIYGSSSPAYTPPLSEQAVICRRELECSPCFERRCRYGHYRCLTEIGVEQVEAAVEQIVADAGGPER